MIVETRDRKTGHTLCRRYRCHGCDKLSRKMKSDALPWECPWGQWVAVWETCYTKTGQLSGGQVQNHYCPYCIRNGMNAKVVAIFLQRQHRARLAQRKKAL